MSLWTSGNGIDHSRVDIWSGQVSAMRGLESKSYLVIDRQSSVFPGFSVILFFVFYSFLAQNGPTGGGGVSAHFDEV